MFWKLYEVMIQRSQRPLFHQKSVFHNVQNELMFFDYVRLHLRILLFFYLIWTFYVLNQFYPSRTSKFDPEVDFTNLTYISCHVLMKCMNSDGMRKLMEYTKKYGSLYRLWFGRHLVLVMSDAEDLSVCLYIFF